MLNRRPLSARCLVAAALLLLWRGGAARGLDLEPDIVGVMAESARAEGEVPGLAVALAVDGRIVWSGGTGLADVEQNVPTTGKTVFRIGSISKPIAATAVMQLVEAGKAKLDDPIQKYVPQFPVKGEQPLTVEHLLSHTGGIRHYRGREFYSAKRFNTLGEAIALFQDDPLLFAPGERYSYSSYGYNLVSGVVESAGGMPLDRYLQERIFEPAKMASARCERGEELVADRARNYARNTQGKLVNSPYVDLSIKWAGGGIIASAEDLARFDIALREGRLLRDETQQRMYQAAKLADGSETEYGLGWRLVKSSDGTPLVGHSGGSVGATTQFLRCPQQQIAVVVLTNLQGTDVARKLGARLMDYLLEKKRATSD